MGEQKKLNQVSLDSKTVSLIEKVLDLEKKYINILWKVFSSTKFLNELVNIENEIKSQYHYLHKNYDIKNKLKIPAERLARYFIYNSNLNNGLFNVKGIYPSPISGDLAFYTEDATVNIDIKTLDINGNSGDIGNLQYLPFQSSFDHKSINPHPDYKNSGIKLPSFLPESYKEKPVLTYFLTIIYEDNSEKNLFQISRNPKYGTVHLTCLPSNKTSVLFDYELIDNFKTYSYFLEDSPYKPSLLCSNCTLNEANKILHSRYMNNSNYKIYKFSDKLALLDLINIHPLYGTYVTWVPVSRKNQKVYDFYLEAIKAGSTTRINEKKLLRRFDSKDAEWEGVKIKTL